MASDGLGIEIKLEFWMQGLGSGSKDPASNGRPASWFRARGLAFGSFPK